MANLPIFAAGTYAKIQPAIEQGILSYPAYVFVSDLNKLAFIDKNLDIQLIVGDNASQVERVDELPDVADGDTSVLYIYDDIVYVFTGTEYKAMYSDATADTTELQEAVDELSSKVTALEESIASITEGSSGLVFSTASEFPEVGVAGQLYIDTSDETGGIYTYDEDTGEYIQLSSVSSASSVTFVELEDEETE